MGEPIKIDAVCQRESSPRGRSISGKAAKETHFRTGPDRPGMMKQPRSDIFPLPSRPIPPPTTTMTASTLLLIVASNLSRGAAIAATGMLIVALALTFITLFIATLPNILAKLESYLPPSPDHHAAPELTDSLTAEDQKVLAAIGFVLHTEFQRQIGQGTSPAPKK